MSRAFMHVHKYAVWVENIVEFFMESIYWYNRFELAHLSRSGCFGKRSPLAAYNNYTTICSIKYLIRLIRCNKRNCVIFVQVCVLLVQRDANVLPAEGNEKSVPMYI